MKSYYPRIADQLIKDKLEGTGAVLVTGPKWCGKSTTSMQIAGSAAFLQNTEDSEQNLMLAQTDMRMFLKGKTPRLIDEWQMYPLLWDAIRSEIDRRSAFGQFILTGSSVPPNLDDRMHSGTGRIARLSMRPMSLWESLDSSGSVSLKEMFDGNFNSCESDIGMEEMAFLICRGGWPSSVGVSEKAALMQAENFYDGLVEADISRVDGIKRDSQRARLLLRSLSRRISTASSYNVIKEDMRANDSDRLDEDTIAAYISALKKLYVQDDIRAWNPNIRSKASIRTSDTRYFCDPSLACAALGLGPSDLFGDIRTFGLLFEALCMRDLKVYAQALGGDIYHYRDSSGLESDAVIHLRNGSWAAVEIKLGSAEGIEAGAKSLLGLSAIIDIEKMKKPSFLMVLTATKYAFRRQDGVYVIPITCLKD